MTTMSMIFLLLLTSVLAQANDITSSKIRVQCDWRASNAAEFPTHSIGHSTPLVARLPMGANGTLVTCIVIGSCEETASWTDCSNGNRGQVLRIIRGSDCATLQSIKLGHTSGPRLVSTLTPAIGDLDLDGVAEIVAGVGPDTSPGLVAFRYDALLHRYVTWWFSSPFSAWKNRQRRAGIVLHDLDDDAWPEVIDCGEVYDGRTGARINVGQEIMYPEVSGDIHQNGNGVFSHVFRAYANEPRAVHTLGTQGEVFEWNTTSSRWSSYLRYVPEGGSGRFFALGDFGSRAPNGTWLMSAFDGVTEVVVAKTGWLALVTLETPPQVLLNYTGIDGGGAPTVADLDADGFPEIAQAGADYFRVFDLDCTLRTPLPSYCLSQHVRWAQASTDQSSARTGSSVFLFGKTHVPDTARKRQATPQLADFVSAVYSDECFTRVYHGASGAVLFSQASQSVTWYEAPSVANVDDDPSVEIMVTTNVNNALSCPSNDFDVIHRGLSCTLDADCAGASTCADSLCRCITDADCEYALTATKCTAALPLDAPQGAKTCRAYRALDALDGVGMRVFEDVRGLFATSRPLWNQNPFSVTNINDDLSIPRTSVWRSPMSDTAVLNSYRVNVNYTVEPCSGACHARGTCVALDQCACEAPYLPPLCLIDACKPGGAWLETAQACVCHEAYGGDTCDTLLCTPGATACVCNGGNQCDEGQCVPSSGVNTTLFVCVLVVDASNSTATSPANVSSPSSNSLSAGLLVLIALLAIFACFAALLFGFIVRRKRSRGVRRRGERRSRSTSAQSRGSVSRSSLRNSAAYGVASLNTLNSNSFAQRDYATMMKEV